MKHFLETLVQRDYNLAAEITAIEDLLHRIIRNDSIKSWFSKKFLEWPHRNNYVSLNAFLLETGLEKIVENSDREEAISLDDYLYYAEYVINMLPYLRNDLFITYTKAITANILNVIGRYNFEIHDDRRGGYHIIEKDVLVLEAAEIAQDSYDLGRSIYSYNYRDMSGDLYAKADILCRLYKYYETIESQAYSYGFKTLADDVAHLSNKLDVRHAPSKKQEIVLGSMTKKEIEEWYDELFRLYLSLIVLVDYKNQRKDINELKSKLG